MNQSGSRSLLIALIALCLVPGVVRPRDAAAGVNRWTAAGPWGGFVWHIAGDPVNPSVIYAATEGGPFKSNDGGETWSRLEGIFKVNGMDMGQRSYWISVAPDRPQLVYAGTDRTVFRSENAGATWKYKSQGLPHSAPMYAIAIDPLAPATVYCASYWDGIFKSTDRGDTWTAAGAGLPAGDPEVFILIVDPQAPSTIYAGLAVAGVYKSVDGGGSWAARGAGLAGNLYSLALDPGNPATLYAGTDRGLFKSGDGGGTWRQTDAGLPAGAPAWSIAVSPDDPAVVWAAVEDQGVWRSGDGGLTWTQSSDGLVTELTAEVFWVHAQRGGTLFAATRAGVYKSSDGGAHWAEKNRGLTAAAVYEVEIAADGAWYAATYGNGIAKSTDRGATWAAVNGGLVRNGGSLWFSALAADPAAPSTLYAAGRSGFYKTTSGGAGWQALPLQEVGQSLLVDPSDHLTVYAGTNTGVFKSGDGGASWLPMKNGLARRVYSLALRPEQPSVVYAGTDSGVYRSLNGGAQWSFRGVAKENIWGLAVDPRRPLLVYGVSDYAPYESADGGETWTSLAQLQEPMSLWAATVHPLSSQFFAAGGDGVWEFHRPPHFWRLDNHDSLTARYVQSLQFDPRDADTLVAGVYGGGVATWTGRGIQWPNGGEQVPAGGIHLVQWVPTPRARHYTLQYSLDAGLKWRTIATGVTQNSYWWRVPLVLDNRKKCLIRLLAYDAQNARLAVDRSDALFTVEVVRMESPWAEETARPGDLYSLHWEVNGTARPTAEILLFFSVDSGQTWRQVAALPADRRRYGFMVPDVASNTCRFRVLLLDASGERLGYDDSDLNLKVRPR